MPLDLLALRHLHRRPHLHASWRKWPDGLRYHFMQQLRFCLDAACATRQGEACQGCVCVTRHPSLAIRPGVGTKLVETMRPMLTLVQTASHETPGQHGTVLRVGQPRNAARNRGLALE